MRRIFLLPLIWLASTHSIGQTVAVDGSTKSTTHFYSDVGRIKWAFPNQDDFIFGVPHFTVGPRVLCTRNIGAECEVQVSARQLYTTIEERRKELLANLDSYLLDALEQSPKIQTFGASKVEYVVLTHKKDNGKIAFGFAAQGPFVIRFKFVGRDPEGKKLSEVLALVQSAKALNRDEFLAFKLADSKAACDKLAPQFSRDNEAAFAGSKYSRIDYRAYFIREASPSREPVDVEASLEKARQEYIAQIAELPKESVLTFCQYFPTQITNAQE